jgi:catechol 2,3-dioxygenase-like lactoylglutathione lyase family enzyme
MTDAVRPTRMTQVGTVFVPVRDQARALAFYVDVLGFEVRADFVYGGGSRWIEVAPPESPYAISLVPPSEGTATRTDQAYCAFVSADLAADHAHLRARGVEADAEISTAGSVRPGIVGMDGRIENPVPAQFFFRDPDGNRFLVVQG